MPRVTSILETCLHVDNVETGARFCEKLFGFLRIDSDQRFCAFEVSAGSMLLWFLERNAGAVDYPGRRDPSTRGSRGLHLAFALPAEDLGLWEDHLTRSGIALEGRVRWPRGGTSLYFRDPDHHFIELATPGIWPSY